MEVDWWCSRMGQWIGKLPVEAIRKAQSRVNLEAHTQDYGSFYDKHTALCNGESGNRRSQSIELPAAAFSRSISRTTTLHHRVCRRYKEALKHRWVVERWVCSSLLISIGTKGSSGTGLLSFPPKSLGRLAGP
jgi:hypothetical protein